MKEGGRRGEREKEKERETAPRGAKGEGKAGRKRRRKPCGLRLIANCAPQVHEQWKSHC